MSSNLEHRVYAVGHYALIVCAVGLLAFFVHVYHEAMTDKTPLCAPPSKEATK